LELILDSKFGSIVPSTKTRSLLFQFSSSVSSTTRKFNAAVLLGIIHNSTGQISHRLILINFDSMTNNTRTNHSLPDELRLWVPLSASTPRIIKSSISFIEEEKNSEQIILVISIIILSLICLILILIIIFLCYRRKPKTIEPTISTNTFKRANSSLSMVEKFHAPDLTTKVTLLTHFQLPELDFGTDV
jgi:Mn2+/Fe2+ NRAMP family transporter